MTKLAPIALFAYRRADLLARTLAALRANGVEHIHAFSDGPRTDADTQAVAEVRRVLGAVNWADVRLVERNRNLGLGASIVDGVSSVLAQHDAAIVCEDDLVAVPGAVAWLSAALEYYRDDPRVLSVSAWTHPRVTPAGMGNAPFFSKRVNTLFWGTWARAWRGMEHGSATERLAAYAAQGGDPSGYGADLPLQAATERERNIWAVRFITHHLVGGGLSLCPPWAMVEHIGYDSHATNAVHDPTWYQSLRGDAAPIPAEWPEPVEQPDVARLWRDAVALELGHGSAPSLMERVVNRLRRLIGGRE